MIGYTTKAQQAADIARLGRDFPIGCAVRKKSGPEWRGKVVGYYSSTFTPEGLVIECIAEGAKGQVHVEPAKRMELEAAEATKFEPEPLPDIGEAVEAYLDAAPAGSVVWPNALHAAFPAMLKSYGISTQPAALVWPGEDDLEAMKDASNHGNSYTAMDRFARRLREWQQANAAGAYGKVHTDGSRSGGQPVAAAPEPTEAEDLAMADALVSEWNKNMGMLRNLALAAMRAERRRARGGAA